MEIREKLTHDTSKKKLELDQKNFEIKSLKREKERIQKIAEEKQTK